MTTVPIPPAALAVLLAAVREMQDADHAARVASDTARTVRSRAISIEAAVRASLHVPDGASLDVDRAQFVVAPAPVPVPDPESVV